MIAGHLVADMNERTDSITALNVIINYFINWNLCRVIEFHNNVARTFWMIDFHVLRSLYYSISFALLTSIGILVSIAY